MAIYGYIWLYMAIFGHIVKQFPVSVGTQGSLLAFGRAYGPKGVWGLK